MTDSYKIIWSDEAIDTLEQIVTYVEVFDRDAAVRLAERLVTVANSLSQFPDRGRPSANNSREMTTLSPYIMRYRVHKNSVEIMRIRHSARMPDD